MNKKLTLLIAVLTVSVLSTGLVLGLGSRSADALCEGAASKTQTVTIEDGKPSAFSVYGKPCDKLTIENLDNVTREIAFGNHGDHVAYDGVSERVLNKGQALTITLNQEGHYHWHDHLHDEVEGYFNVNQ